MEGWPLVVLFGSSLLMAGLQSSLQAIGRLQVVRMEQVTSESEERVRELRPDVIIFDSLESRIQDWPSLARMMTENPHLLLLALGADTSDFIALSGKRVPITGLADIVNVIQVGASSR